jgi:hypothetical protein
VPDRPLGHTAEAVLSYVPRWRTHQVRYLNVADLERPVGLNILAGHDQAHRHRATAAVVDVFASIWDLSLSRTPLLLDVLGYTVAALTEVPGATLLLVSRFLTDQGYRERLVEAHVSDPAVRAYWLTTSAPRPARAARDVRLGAQQGRRARREPVLRNIFGQEHNKLDIGHHPRPRHPDRQPRPRARSVARTPAHRRLHRLPVNTTRRGAHAALARRVGEDPQAAAWEYPDFYVYADEFQDLATARFDDALSQSRNGRVSFALFNQFQAQLSEQVKAALFGNVGSLVAFEVGA